MQLWSIGDFIQKENNIIVMCDTFCAISCISSTPPPYRDHPAKREKSKKLRNSLDRDDGYGHGLETMNRPMNIDQSCGIFWLSHLMISGEIHTTRTSSTNLSLCRFIIRTCAVLRWCYTCVRIGDIQYVQSRGEGILIPMQLIE